MSKYSIGLDLGINNVGWAIYDFSTQMIIDKGVVRFKESSDAEDRRNLRGSRRLNKRAHHRVERLAILLNSISFCTARSYEPNLLQKRIKGLKEKLDEQEIANIIYYFAIHRGYIPFDDEKPERTVYNFNSESELKYPCQYINQYYQERGKYRGSCELILLEDNLRELKAILKEQQKYHKKLNDDIIDKICQIISSKRKFWEGPGAPYDNQLSPYGRYRTIDDLKMLEKQPNYHKYLYEMLIGKDILSMDEFGQMSSVAPRFNFYAEEFNFYNDFINMRVKNPSDIDEQYRDKINFKTGKFTGETIQEFRNEILTAKKVDFKKILNKVLGLKEDDIEGYRVDKDYKPNISKYDFYKYLLKQFEDKNISTEWITSSDKAIYNQVIYVLTVAPTSMAIPEMLIDRITERQFTEEEIEVLKNIKQKKNSELKYHSLSEVILKKVLKDMAKTEYQFNFMQLLKKLGYEDISKEYFQNHYSNKNVSPYFIESKNIDDLMANPQVKKTLRKAIKVINAIIKKYHDYPDTIVIESAKEMNGNDRRKEIENEQKIYENLNKNAQIILEQNGYNVSDTNIEKVIYWEETEEKCIYCGKPISINEVLKTEIEHILPISQSMDNSSNNKTCSCYNCNKEKAQRTPYAFLSSIGTYDDFKKRVIECKNISNAKKYNFLFEGNIDKYEIKFINRNLRDTAYASVALANELKKYNEFLSAKEGYTINIMTSPGQVTSNIRSKMDAKGKDRTYLYHHVIDAMILASLADTKLGEILIASQNDGKYWINEKNEKHRNKVVEMLKFLKLNNLDQIKEFNKDCENMPDDNKEGLIKRSYEVLKNPIRQFSDTNYVKYIKIEDEFYKISQISNIYDLKIHKKDGSDDVDKKNLDILFDTNDKRKVLLCEKKDPHLFQKLKEIYIKNSSSINPFVDECKYANGLEEDTKIDYMKHGIRKTNNPNSPVVIKLRYLEKVTNPYLKNEIKNKRLNKFGEFTVNNKKANTYVGLEGLSQVCTRIFYSYDDKKFIFLPICAISFRNNQLDEKENNYINTYQRLIGDKKVKKMFDLYCGDWVEVIKKKDGECKAGRYSCYDKTCNNLVIDTNGLNNITATKIVTSDQAIILYTIDILGNKYKKFDTRDLL